MAQPCPGRIAACAVLLASVAMSQSSDSFGASIPIGNENPPWGAAPYPGPIAMTPDGMWIYAIEIAAFGCQPPDIYQLSRVRPDGTDHQVLRSSAQLDALNPGKLDMVTFLRVSGDGRRVYFVAPDHVQGTGSGGCFLAPPFHHYLLDVETDELQLFAPDGLPYAGDPSWTDDGQTMAFAAYNDATLSKWFYIGGPDGSGAVPFLEAQSGWTFSDGVLSGDGSKFLVTVGYNNVAPLNGDVFNFDLATRVLTKLTPGVVSGLTVASFSGDGSRVVHDDGLGATYAVNGDGSNYRLLAPPLHYRPTITRNGESVFVVAQGPDKRIPWLGGAGMQMPGVLTSESGAPVNAEGSIGASWGVIYSGGQFVPLSPHYPLTVWHEHLPVLATYGETSPGLPLSLTVGGKLGTPFLVGASLVEGSEVVPGLGVLQLDPAQLFVLGAGTITSISNTGTQQFQLPVNYNLPADLPVHFQALGFAADGTKQLTNRTTFTIPASPPITPADLSFGGGPPHPPGVAAHGRSLIEPADVWTRHLMTDPTLPLRVQPPAAR